MRKTGTKISIFNQTKKLFFLILNILLIYQGIAQPGFELKFGTPDDDRARSLQQLSDGCIYIAGFSNAGPHGGYDISLSKVSPAGQFIWTKYYGGPYDDFALYINKTADDRLILCGERYDGSANLDAWIMKVDTAGNVVWTNGVFTPLNESYKYIEQTSDGGFIMCGFQSDSSNSNDIFVVKTDSAGDVQWQKAYGGTDNDYADAIKQTADGGYLISADTKSWGLPHYDIYMLKIDSAGNYEWDNFSGGPYADGCQGFIITSDHSYFTFGESIVDWNLPYQYFLQLTDSSGTVLWENYMGGLGADAAFSAVETPDSGFIVTGYSNSHDVNSPIDLVLFKVSKQGDSLWSQYYGGTGIDLGYQIINCIGGGYLVVGTTWQNDNDYHLLKIDESGYTGINSLQSSDEKFKLFPNPAKDYIELHHNYLSGSAVFAIFSLQGKLLKTETRLINGNKERFYLDLPPGYYLIRVQTDDKIYVSSVIIR